jgi:hypothetical protein
MTKDEARYIIKKGARWQKALWIKESGLYPKGNEKLVQGSKQGEENSDTCILGQYSGKIESKSERMRWAENLLL